MAVLPSQLRGRATVLFLRDQSTPLLTLSLENGYPYFDTPIDLDRHDISRHYPKRGVTVRFVESSVPDPAYAVFAMADTNEAVGDGLSASAAATSRRIKVSL
jgi:hypothetical protein